jgi:hypothetical protein
MLDRSFIHALDHLGRNHLVLFRSYKQFRDAVDYRMILLVGLESVHSVPVVRDEWREPVVRQETLWVERSYHPLDAGEAVLEDQAVTDYLAIVKVLLGDASKQASSDGCAEAVSIPYDLGLKPIPFVQLGIFTGNVLDYRSVVRQEGSLVRSSVRRKSVATRRYRYQIELELAERSIRAPSGQTQLPEDG